MPCPIGTYNDTTGQSMIEDCTPCDPGYFCNDTGLIKPTALCDIGYFCESGSAAPNPNPTGSASCTTSVGSVYPSIGDTCPTGSFCEEGSQSPKVCVTFMFSQSVRLHVIAFSVL